MLRIWRRRPSPAMVVAIIALFAALTGTAAALRGHNSVRSDDIKNKQVKTQDLAKRAVTPSRTNVVKRSQARSAQVTSSTTPVALTGGPSVAVKVPRAGMVAVWASAQMSVTGSNHHARVDLFEPSLLPGGSQILQTGSNTLQSRFSAPGTNDEDGVQGSGRAGWIVFAPSAGKYRFSLGYSAPDGGNATFTNRRLYVTVLG
jgi:hypothetical protein